MATMDIIAGVSQGAARGMRRLVITVSLSACALAIVSACASAAEQCERPSRRGIIATFDRWNAALASGDIQQIVDLYSDHAVLTATTADVPHTGKQAIRSVYQTLLQRHLRASVITRTVQIDCDAATDSGIVVYRVTGRRKGTRMLLGGRYLMQYRLEGESWRIVRHHLSANPIGASKLADSAP